MEEESQLVPGGDPEMGRQALQAYGCRYCHTIPGVPQAEAKIGPPLSDWAERAYIAGSFQNTPKNLTQWILAPQAFEPATAMPDLGVTDQDALDMAAYLFTLERRGWISETMRSIARVLPYGVEETEPEVDPIQVNEPVLTEDQELVRAGFETYSRYCASCHRWDGGGIDGSVPGLSGNSLVVTDDPSSLIETILFGHSGTPDFLGKLSDRQLAAVVSMIRNAWLNNARVVNIEMIRDFPYPY